MITATDTTVFDIAFDPASSPAPGVAPYSARGLKGTLSLSDGIGSSNLRRTINGALVDLNPPQMRKYKLEISGGDQAPPALDGVWPGMEVAVDSNVELAFLTAGGSAGRTMVPGSERFEGDFTYYCLRMTMRVVDLQVERDEWDAAVTWSLTLEEI